MSDTHEDRIRAARAFLAAVPVIEGLLSRTLSQFSSLTPFQRERMSVALHSRSEALEAAMLEGMAELMTGPEIEAMARFYSTREGQSIFNKMPLVMADAVKRFGPVLQAVMAEVLR